MGRSAIACLGLLVACGSPRVVVETTVVMAPQHAASAPMQVVAPVSDEGWTAERAMPRPASTFGAAAYGGHVYVGGGYDGSHSSKSVYVAEIGADGHLGAWQETTPFERARCQNAMVAARGYVYVLGGYECGGVALADVQVAKIQPDGTLGPWRPTSSFETPRYGMGAVAANGFVYVLGGVAVPDATADVQVAAIETDGTLGPWEHTSRFAGPRSMAGVAVWGGRIYVAGGAGDDPDDTRIRHSYGTRHLDDVQSAGLQADGSLGAWREEAARLERPVAGGAMVATDGRLYLVGSAAVSAAIGADGRVGGWCDEPALASQRLGVAAVATPARVYVLGGTSPSASYRADVESMRAANVCTQ